MVSGAFHFSVNSCLLLLSALLAQLCFTISFGVEQMWYSCITDYQTYLFLPKWLKLPAGNLPWLQLSVLLPGGCVGPVLAFGDSLMYTFSFCCFAGVMSDVCTVFLSESLLTSHGLYFFLSFLVCRLWYDDFSCHSRCIWFHTWNFFHYHMFCQCTNKASFPVCLSPLLYSFRCCIDFVRC